MIRILQCVNNMHRAGLETMLMNYYRNLDRNQIQFDFLTHRSDRSDYDDEIESLGGKIYYAPRLYPKNYPQYFSYMEKFFEEHKEYRIVHSHIDSMSYLPLFAAKKAGVPIRIAHSHNTAIDFDYKYFLKNFFRKKINSVATHYFSCGEEAGNFLFGKNASFDIIHNAIDADKFCFNAFIREQKRKELKIDNKFVVGHVGRMVRQKNHKFLIQVFVELLHSLPNAVLLLIGVGEEEENIKKIVQKNGLEEKVLFLGNRNDVAALYQAMDVFVLTSFYEGVPVVGIEAQFAGLPCVFSTGVPKEVNFSGKCEFLSIGIEPKQWSNYIVNLNIEDRKSEMFSDSLFRIENAQKELEKKYFSLLSEISYE